MSIQGLGYVGVRAKSLEDWSDFGTKFLGMQLVDKSRSSLALRMDDRKQRVVVSEDGGEGVAFFGWEVADAATLDALRGTAREGRRRRSRAARARSPTSAGSKDLIVFADPLGNRLEIFHGAETASEPFKPGRSISGFRTGPLGMGHAVLHVKNINDAVPFYRDVLGFRLSDYMLRPFNAYFFHANPRHHSIAFIETGRNATHHLMVELLQPRRRRPVLRPRAAARKAASASRSAATSTTRSPRSTRTRRRASWWSTAGAAASSTSTTGSRRRSPGARACGATTACG